MGLVLEVNYKQVLAYLIEILTLQTKNVCNDVSSETVTLERECFFFYTKYYFSQKIFYKDEVEEIFQDERKKNLYVILRRDREHVCVCEWGVKTKIR